MSIGFDPFSRKEYPKRSYINMEPEQPKSKRAKHKYVKMQDDEDGGNDGVNKAKRKREGAQGGRTKTPEKDSPIKSQKVFESVRDSLILNAEKTGNFHQIVQYAREDEQLEYLQEYSLKVLDNPEIARRVGFQLLFNACESGDIRKAQLQRVKLNEMGFTPDAIASLSEEIDADGYITPDKAEAHRIINEYTKEEIADIRQGIDKLNQQDILDQWGG